MVRSPRANSRINFTFAQKLCQILGRDGARHAKLDLFSAPEEPVDMADSPDIIGPPDTRVEDQTRPMEPAEVAAGGMIGSYLLLESLGEGGMGEVWLAEQKHPVRRRVAIKLIKPGMDTREVVARFESERQALALMNHPAIAKVYDAGSTPQGRPYFVMEYVNGIAITQYCDTQKLTMRQRLELFSSVCDAVQHAHQKAILHRDLKPSNILVGEVDGKPLPRIIDFGVAKAMSQASQQGPCLHATEPLSALRRI
jgi:non-specific serine/threonine protein kinase/serine/threonine-protein kinase